MNHSRGFTLVELLVVVAIVGVLSSVVLVSLRVARENARDAAIKASVVQLRAVMQQEFADTGSYAAIKQGGTWKGPNTNCSSATFTGSYATQARNICNDIMRAYEGSPGCTTNCLYFQATLPDATNKFTIMAYLPGESARVGGTRYFCVGSGGGSSISSTVVNSVTWGGEGCYANP